MGKGAIWIEITPLRSIKDLRGTGGSESSGRRISERTQPREEGRRLFVELEGGRGKRVTRCYVVVCVNSVDGQHRRVLLAARIVYSPLEGPELRKPAKVTRVGRYHCYSQTACAHCHQGIVGQAPLPDLLVIVLGG